MYRSGEKKVVLVQILIFFSSPASFFSCGSQKPYDGSSSKAVVYLFWMKGLKCTVQHVNKALPQNIKSYFLLFFSVWVLWCVSPPHNRVQTDIANDTTWRISEFSLSLSLSLYTMFRCVLVLATFFAASHTRFPSLARRGMKQKIPPLGAVGKLRCDKNSDVMRKNKNTNFWFLTRRSARTFFIFCV